MDSHHRKRTRVREDRNGENERLSGSRGETEEKSCPEYYLKLSRAIKVGASTLLLLFKAEHVFLHNFHLFYLHTIHL